MNHKKLVLEVPAEKYDEVIKAIERITGVPVINQSMIGKKVFAFNLIRVRESENDAWTCDLFMVVDDNAEISKTEEILRNRISQFLKTKEGWEANVRSSCDFNWGDFVMKLPDETLGIYLDAKDVQGGDFVFAPDIRVDQDELLAYDVSASGTVVLKNLAGETQLECPGEVDFSDGSVTIDIDCGDEEIDEEELFSRVATGTIVLTNGEEFELDPAELFNKLTN